MKDHILRKHPENFQGSTSAALNSPSTSASGDNHNTSLVVEKYYNDGSTRKKYLDNLFTLMIAKDMEPLRLSEREGLKEFVAGLDPKYHLPSRFIVSTKLLPKLYAKEKVKVYEMIKNASHVAITTDMWTSINNQGICAITCHFYANRKLQSALLEAVVCEGNHTADNIATVSY